ncbi:MAG: GNAT family N-acetyltransferase, partial [Desulfobacteraceae bacterium]|nr:GNAT family N-acetyltransferase [Desulfobacteraceae bacterium]
FLVKEELHGMGIGTRLLDILEDIAKKNGFKGFTALVLAENHKMIKVFKKRYPNAKFSRGGSGEVDVEMPFEL